LTDATVLMLVALVQDRFAVAVWPRLTTPCSVVALVANPPPETYPLVGAVRALWATPTRTWVPGVGDLERVQR